MQPGDIAAFNADGKLIPAVVMAINEDGTLDLSVLPVNYRKIQVSEDPKASGTVFLPTVYGYDKPTVVATPGLTDAAHALGGEPGSVVEVTDEVARRLASGETVSLPENVPGPYSGT